MKKQHILELEQKPYSMGWMSYLCGFWMDLLRCFRVQKAKQKRFLGRDTEQVRVLLRLFKLWYFFNFFNVGASLAALQRKPIFFLKLQHFHWRLRCSSTGFPTPEPEAICCGSAPGEHRRSSPRAPTSLDRLSKQRANRKIQDRMKLWNPNSIRVTYWRKKTINCLFVVYEICIF